jgi:hypothetical protein
MADRALKLESFHCSPANCLRLLRRARTKWPAKGCENVLHFRTGKVEQGGMSRGNALGKMRQAGCTNGSPRSEA